MKKQNGIKRLFNVLDKWKKFYWAAAALMIFSQMLRMLQPKILQIVIDGVIVFFINGKLPEGAEKDEVATFLYNLLPELQVNNLTKVLIGIGIIYGIIAILRSLTQVASAAITASSTEKAIKKMRDHLFNHIQKLPITFLKGNNTGEMIQRCTGDVETIRRFILNQVVELIRFAAIFIFAFIMMYMVNVKYALLAIVCSPIIAITTYYFFKKEKIVWDEHEDEADVLTQMVNENLNGIRVVKAFANEDFEKKRFDKQNIKKRAVGIKQVKLHAFFWTFSDLLIHLQIAVSIFYGGYLTLNDILTVGEFSAFFTYGIMVTWPMRQIGRIMSQMGMATVAMERLSKIIDAEEEDFTGKPIENLQGDIEFDNVSFKYPDSEKYVLNKVSFKLKAGKVLALVGATGSGKSSIVNLLLRFYEPTEGNIFIDGINIKDYNKANLRASIGVVLQKPFLFSTTIESNIAYALPKNDEQKVLEAAKVASIDEIKHIFSNGYKTLVGEKGVTLSGGQKQRVALARTILENPKMLILDDATSAVDAHTEHKIQSALKQKVKDKTTIIIAHRASSIQNADLIAVLENGKLIEFERKEILLEKEGFYKEMVSF